MIRSAATENVYLIHRTYFYGIWQMRMTDRSLIDKINPTFIALTATAIHRCLAAWTPGRFSVLPEFGRAGGAQRECDTWTINHTFINACTDVFRHLDIDFCSSSPQVQAKEIDNIRSMMCQSIHSTSTDPAMVQPYNNQGRNHVDFLDYVPEELIELPGNSFNCLCRFVAATEASMGFSGVLPMGWSAISSSSQPVPCRDSNGNNNDITSITNNTSIENTGLVVGSTIVECAMSLRG